VGLNSRGEWILVLVDRHQRNLLLVAWFDLYEVPFGFTEGYVSHIIVVVTAELAYRCRWQTITINHLS